VKQARTALDFVSWLRRHQGEHPWLGRLERCLQFQQREKALEIVEEVKQAVVHARALERDVFDWRFRAVEALNEYEDLVGRARQLLDMVIEAAEKKRSQASRKAKEARGAALEEIKQAIEGLGGASVRGCFRRTFPACHRRVEYRRMVRQGS
jgi:hypothetical protein